MLTLKSSLLFSSFLIFGRNSTLRSRLDTILGQEFFYKSSGVSQTYQDPRISCWALCFWVQAVRKTQSHCQWRLSTFQRVRIIVRLLRLLDRRRSHTTVPRTYSRMIQNLMTLRMGICRNDFCLFHFLQQTILLFSVSLPYFIYSFIVFKTIPKFSEQIQSESFSPKDPITFQIHETSLKCFKHAEVPRGLNRSRMLVGSIASSYCAPLASRSRITTKTSTEHATYA